MDIKNYIKGNSTPIYLIVKINNYILSTDNFCRVFYFKDNNLIKVENSELVKELYNNLIYLENHPNDLKTQSEIRKNRIYNSFLKFVAEEGIKKDE